MMPYRWRVMLTEWLFDWAGPWHILGASVILPFAQADPEVSRSTIVWFTVIYSISTATCILANLPALVVEAFPGDHRGKTLGIMGLGGGIGFLFASPLAGVLADTLG